MNPIRKIRQQAEEKRFALVKQQEVIYETHCKNCRDRLDLPHTNSMDACLDCPIFEKSCVIGEQLNEITRNSRVRRYAELFKKPVQELSARDYQLLKGMYTDREIAKLFKVRYVVFLEWKKRVIYGLEVAK